MVVLNEDGDLAEGEEKGQRKGRKTKFTEGLSGKGGEALSCIQRQKNLLVPQP